jgi:hypothetical protein
MSAVATEAPGFTIRSGDSRSAKRLFEPSEVTLEDSILGAWEALEARGRAECPVCHATLERGGCVNCGSRLS